MSTTPSRCNPCTYVSNVLSAIFCCGSASKTAVQKKVSQQKKFIDLHIDDLQGQIKEINTTVLHLQGLLVKDDATIDADRVFQAIIKPKMDAYVQSGNAPGLRYRAPLYAAPAAGPAISSAVVPYGTGAAQRDSMIQNIEDLFNDYRYPNRGNIEDARWKTPGHRESIMQSLLSQFTPQQQTQILNQLSSDVKAQLPGLFRLTR